MTSRKKQATSFKTEAAVQTWIEHLISSGEFASSIRGLDRVETLLNNARSPENRPEFPLDYICRIKCLEAAFTVGQSLGGLEILSTHSRSVSRTASEALFVDILCNQQEGGGFVVGEIKNSKSSTRETVTEILAYEQELLNHAPFSSHLDVLFIVVSRDHSVLLNHSLGSLITWGRRKILCLRLDDSGSEPCLHVHLPDSWESFGCQYFPKEGLKIAQLCLYDTKLNDQELCLVMETALNLMVREADRTGGSGFAMLLSDHLSRRYTAAPFTIFAGAINPYVFLRNSHSFLRSQEPISAIGEHLVDEESAEILSVSWEWMNVLTAGVEYLNQFGSPIWEASSTWDHFRSPQRWRLDSLTPDRHLCPLLIDFWGEAGDFCREEVRNFKRMQCWTPGFARVGADWRRPDIGVALLDHIALTPLVKGGRWTVSALHGLGLRLGRYGAIAAGYADASQDVRRKQQASRFWAIADMVEPIHELGWRYRDSDMSAPPPTLQVSGENSGAEVLQSVQALAKWIETCFLKMADHELKIAFAIGLQSFAFYDPLFVSSGKKAEEQHTRKGVIVTGRRWLELAFSLIEEEELAPLDRQNCIDCLKGIFKALTGAKESVSEWRKAAKALQDEDVIDLMFERIPQTIDLCVPQAFHILNYSFGPSPDWEWHKRAILKLYSKGVKYPCIYIDAGGQVQVAALPENQIVYPIINDPHVEVLVCENRAGFELTIRKKWSDLMR